MYNGTYRNGREPVYRSKRRAPRYWEEGEKFCTARIVLFFVSLAVMFVIALLLPLRPSHSDFEKRDLAKFPKFSMETLLNGSFFDDIDVWFSDTFPFRDDFVTLNSQLKDLYGMSPVQVSGNVEQGDEIPSAPAQPSSSETSKKPESSEASSEAPESSTAEESEASESSSSQEAPAPEKDVTGEVTQSLGAVLIVGDSAYEYYNFSQSVADQYVALVNRAAQGLEGTTKVYDMIVPTSMDILLPESFRSGINTSSQKDAIAYMYGSMASSVNTVPIYDTLKAHADEYVYFRTDHHWTALGAYYSYRQFAEKAGFTPLELGEYTTKEFDGFLGAFYSDTGKSTALTKNPDTVVAYVPPGDITLTFTDTSGSQREWPLISDVSTWAASSKYSTFIGGDNPYTVIKNASVTDGSSCVVVKESFGNAFVPFLTSHYQTVYVIDYRYWNGDLVKFTRDAGAQDLLFVNNISATRNSSLVGKMDSLVKG